MKYGILVHKYSRNIGDDIQSYALSRFYPKIDYEVDREALDVFESENNEPVAVIMSAWFMWKKWNWPPSNCIIPKFVGLHYNLYGVRQKASPIQSELLTDIGGDYFKAYAPIGLRDYDTKKIFDEAKIDNYFSGCITLTLPKQKMITKEKEYICIVDIHKNAEKRIRRSLKGTNIEIKKLSHKMKTDNSKLTWKEREEKIEQLLQIYQNAKCVITERLHVSLPCLAMEVPVLCLVSAERETNRFKPYNEWLHLTTPEEFIKGRYEYDILNPPSNSEVYKKTREKLINDLDLFIQNVSRNGKTTENLVKTEYSEVDLLRWKNKLMKKTLNDWFYENRVIVNELISKQKTVDLISKILPINMLLKIRKNFIKKVK